MRAGLLRPSSDRAFGEGRHAFHGAEIERSKAGSFELVVLNEVHQQMASTEGGVSELERLADEIGVPDFYESARRVG